MNPSPGAFVVIKSGGPTMTVLRVDGDDVTCVWSEKGVQRQEVFPAVVLTLYVPPPTSIRVTRA